MQIKHNRKRSLWNNCIVIEVKLNRLFAFYEPSYYTHNIASHIYDDIPCPLDTLSYDTIKCQQTTLWHDIVHVAQ